LRHSVVFPYQMAIFETGSP